MEGEKEQTFVAVSSTPLPNFHVTQTKRATWCNKTSGKV